MAKTLRTSGDYTIKAGDGFNSGSGTNTITFDSLNVSVSGNLTVGGSSSTISTTNTIIEDNIIELQTGISASSNDSGIIIERGSTGDNAAIIWDESVDSFKLGTTTATGADKSGGITVTAGALGIGALTATTGTFSGAVSSVGHTVEGNITAGSVTTNEITANGSNATLTVASSGTGDATIDAGGDIILDADNADIKLQDGGTEFGRISRITSDLVIKSMGDDKDIILKGLDNSATINALTLDMSEAGAATFNSTVTVGGAMTATSVTANDFTSNGSNADITVAPQGTGDINLTAGADVNIPANIGITFGDDGEKIEGDGSDLTISSSNNTTIDSAGSIFLSADGNGLIDFKDGGTTYLRFSEVSNNAFLKNMISDGDVIIKGIDGGAEVTALTLDMSAAGAATFNSTVTATDITANSLTTNAISSNGSNAELSLQASGTGDVVISALRVNGTTLDSADSTKVTIAEAVDVTGDLTVGDDISLISDSAVLGFGADNDTTLTHTDGTGLTLNSTNKLCFNDTGTFIHSNADGDLDLSSDGTNNDSIKITSAGGITLDANETSATGVINLDAHYHGYVGLKDNGTTYGNFTNLNASNFNITSSISDADMVFRGNDGGVTTTALTLDMSAAGAATFNSTVTVGGVMTATSVTANDFTSNGSNADITVAPQGTGDINLTAGADVNIPANIGITFGDDGEKIEGDGTNLTVTSSGALNLDVAGNILLDSASNGFVAIRDNGTTYIELSENSGTGILKTSVSDGDFLIRGNDGGAEVTALTLDMSAAGAATFNSTVTVGGVMTATSVTANDFTSNGSNADITVAPQGTGDINLNAGADVNIPSGIGLTLGDDGEKIEGDGTRLFINSSNAIRMTAVAEIRLDSNSGNVQLYDNGVEYGLLAKDGSDNAIFKSSISDANMILKGNDGGVTINALTFDMSEAGAATFNDMVTVGGSFKKAIHTFTATDAITEVEHAGRTLLLGEVGGNANVVLTLPDATGSGNIYHFIVSVAMGGSTTYKIQVPDADNTIAGQIQYLDEDGTAVTSFPTVAASDTITLNSGTQGGIVGDTLTLIDIATDKYAVSGQMRVSAGANPATPFSAAVS